MVIDPSKLSGTLANINPMKSRSKFIKLYLSRIYPITTANIDIPNATIEIIITNLSSSYLSIVLPVFEANVALAILPITVLSPISITIPVPLPSTHSVPKKTKFSVSKGLSGFVQSTTLC